MVDAKGGMKIKVTKGGPYLVTGNISMSKQIIITDKKKNSLRWEESTHYPEKEEYALCRCGHSSSKPYCDGSHKGIDFDGIETASMDNYLDRAKECPGPNLMLTDVQRLCASGRFCDRAGGVWKLTKKSDDPESREIAIQEACDCPSGRLVAWDKTTGEAMEPEYPTSIGLIQDTGAQVSGPIWARGGIPIESCEGIQYQLRNRVTLCRCGRSENKPFCDATHILVGFSDED